MFEFLDQFGGKKDILILLIFVGILFLTCSLIKRRKLRLVVSFFSAAFIAVQLTSLFTTQSFAGYQFYVHFNLRGLTGVSGLFIPHLIALIVLFLGLFLLNIYSRVLVDRIFKLVRIEKLSYGKKSVIVGGLMLFATSGILINGTFINDSKSLSTLFQSHESNFKAVLEKNGMNDYVTPDQLKANAGKNIIVLSLESLESAYLSDKYEHLTPNLNKLKAQWNYYDIKPNLGSSWTTGSMYTLLTGFPAYFGRSSNNIFRGVYHSKISSITHTLKNAGYETIFLNGNVESGGMSDMLFTFSFDKVIDVKNARNTGHESGYGLRDKDLFDLAKTEIKSRFDNKEHFALFLSTTDTHFPDGIYDARMTKVIKKQNTDLEFMVAALDHMVGELITYLKEQNILDNTIVFIVPDHLKMGDPSMFEGTGERGLYLITNSKKKLDKENEYYQIDLPKLILAGAEIEHNQTFFTDFIPGNKSQFIRDNINQITSINVAGISRIDQEEYVVPTISKHYKQYKSDTSRFIAHAGGAIDGIRYTNSLEALEHSYQNGFRLFELDILKTSDGKYVAAHDWEKWKSATGYKGKIPVSERVFLSHKIYKKYTPMGMDRINQWFEEHPDAILITDKINEPKSFSRQFIASDRLMMELFSQQAVMQAATTKMRSAMPSWPVLEKMNLAQIQKLKIKHVSISRYGIVSNKKRLKQLKNLGIRVYVFDVNQDGGVMDSGMDEEYVTKFELDYVYGMYADKWNFK